MRDEIWVTLTLARPPLTDVSGSVLISLLHPNFKIPQEANPHSKIGMFSGLHMYEVELGPNIMFRPL